MDLPDFRVSRAEQLERLAFGSFRVEGHGTEVQLVPDTTRGAAADLAFGTLPAVDVSPGDFGNFFLKKPAQAWSEFVRCRKVVQQERKGHAVRAVTSNIADALARRNLRGAETVGGLRRRYYLAQLLTDPHLRDKFGVHGALYTKLRNLAVVNPAAAARTAQEHIRASSGVKAAIVTAGEYARTVRRAWDCVEYFASMDEAVSVSVECTIIGNKAFMYAPDRSGWYVMGPLRAMVPVSLVHRMVCCSSPADVMFALGSELTLLDIDIHNGSDFESPVREAHAGDHADLPTRSSPRALEVLSGEAYGRLARMCVAVEPVVADGKHVASAVRVGPKYALVNSHVLDEGEVLSLGDSVFKAVRPLSQDLWLVEAESSVPFSWGLRDARPGEAVVVCYRRYSKLLVSPPVTVRTAAGGIVTVSGSSEFVAGMSGGAVLALSDLAFLGLYDGQGLSHGLVAAFTPGMYTELCTAELRSESGSRGAASSPYARLERKGLRPVLDAAAACLLPVVAEGSHVGMVFLSGGRVTSTLSPDRLALPQGRTPYVRVGGAYVCEAGADAGSCERPVLLRAPQAGEEVFVLGVDAQGPYYTDSTATVGQVGLGGATFRIEGLSTDGVMPLAGGAVVSCSDGAVLGLCEGEVGGLSAGGDPSGIGCVALPGGVPEGAAGPRPLAGRFPSLRVEAWPAPVYAEVEAVHQGLGAEPPPRAGLLPLVQVGRDWLGAVVAGLAWGGRAPVGLTAGGFSCAASPLARVAFERGAALLGCKGFQGLEAEEAVLVVVGAAVVAEGQAARDDFVAGLLEGMVPV